MKVLLIFPRYKIWNTPTQMPLGIGYIASTLLKEGIDVKILDLMAEEPEVLEEVLKSFKPELAGISSTTPQIKTSWEVAGKIKKISPSTVVMIGGVHVTALPEESLAVPEVDLVARGEGEETVLDFCRNFAPRENWSNVLGISYKDGNGQVVHNDPRPLIKDVDNIPLPAFHLFNTSRYSITQPLIDRQTKESRAFYITTSRGCPYNCVYCFKGVYGQTWRPRSAENVVAEWDFLVNEMGATEIGVQDDVFNLKLDRAKQICRLLIEKKLNRVPWIINNGMRLDIVDDELMALMKESGCKRVAFGVESGDIQIRKVIGKPFTEEQIQYAFRLAKKHKLMTSGFFMFGNPYENKETMEKTIKFAVKINPQIAHFTIATPFPSTGLYKYISENGKFLTTDWNDYGLLEGHALFSAGELTPELMVKMWHKAYRSFYLRPQRVVKEILTPANWLKIPKLVRAASRYFIK
ncbi:MAG: radical SAM protein [Armatimonadota bacterium]